MTILLLMACALGDPEGGARAEAKAFAGGAAFGDAAADGAAFGDAAADGDVENAARQALRRAAAFKRGKGGDLEAAQALLAECEQLLKRLEGADGLGAPERARLQKAMQERCREFGAFVEANAARGAQVPPEGFGGMNPEALRNPEALQEQVRQMMRAMQGQGQGQGQFQGPPMNRGQGMAFGFGGGFGQAMGRGQAGGFGQPMGGAQQGKGIRGGK